MANPQLEDGYTPIANEILEALARINLGAYEVRTLFYLIRKTYGWKKKKDWISLSQFSKGLGLDRRNVFRALKSLHGKGLVVICRDDKKHPTYGFQKNYERWQISDCDKVELVCQNLKRRKKKESVYSDDKVSSLQTPTKETLTKETVRKKKEEKEEKTFFSLKEIQNQNKQEEQHLHEWLLREQAKFINEHGADDIDKVDWKQYAKTYYVGRENLCEK